MPLLKRKPFPSAELPKDLESHELVYQVRFTKEIFRNYDEYLNRVNIYRKRLWMCAVTGKSNLTYEEALVSEKLAMEKVQQFPKELTAPALRIIQYSMLSLKDLSDAIAEKLQERLVVGTELCGRRDNKICPCKIVKILEEGNGKVHYEVAWLDKSKKVVTNELVNADVLIQKKFPLSRNVLKSFIRRSTYRSGPWVVHDKLAQDHGISTTIPQELRSKAFFRDGLLFCSKKRKTNGAAAEGNNDKDDNQLGAIKYPINDLLVQPCIDDPVFTDRPSPTREFNIPMDTVGDLLMVWDFCSSFGRLLNLYPFSLEDFENAICHKDSNSSLLVESHSSLFRLLMKDDSDYFLLVQNRKRKFKITLFNWADYLCDFLEFIDIPEFRANTATIKRGHYYLLDAHAKLRILKELVNQAIETITLKEKLDEFIEQRQLLGATRRGEALEEGRLKREKKEWLKSQSISQGVVNYRNDLISTDSNGVVVNNMNGEVTSSSKNFASLKRDKKHLDTVSQKVGAKVDIGAKVLANGKDSVREESIDHNMEATGRTTKEQRKEYYEREMEKRFVRTNPLGKDRHYNRYWWFRRDGRIFVESSDSKQWGYYISVEELDALKSSLNCKGERERALQMQLEKFYSRICTEINKRSKEMNHKISSEEAILRRSTRVRASPRENPSTAFLRYINKWKVD